MFVQQRKGEGQKYNIQCNYSINLLFFSFLKYFHDLYFVILPCLNFPLFHSFQSSCFTLKIMQKFTTLKSIPLWSRISILLPWISNHSCVTQPEADIRTAVHICQQSKMTQKAAMTAHPRENNLNQGFGPRVGWWGEVCMGMFEFWANNLCVIVHIWWLLSQHAALDTKLGATWWFNEVIRNQCCGFSINGTD